MFDNSAALSVMMLKMCMVDIQNLHRSRSVRALDELDPVYISSQCSIIFYCITLLNWPSLERQVSLHLLGSDPSRLLNLTSLHLTTPLQWVPISCISCSVCNDFVYKFGIVPLQKQQGYSQWTNWIARASWILSSMKTNKSRDLLHRSPFQTSWANNVSRCYHSLKRTTQTHIDGRASSSPFTLVGKRKKFKERYTADHRIFSVIVRRSTV